MPDLDFTVSGVGAADRGMTPMLHFKLGVSNTPATERIQAAIVHAQIQIQAPQRAYKASEQRKLFELFGPPEQWGQTLHNRLWTHSHTTLQSFEGRTESMLPVPCTYDLNIAATKYFHALEDGEVPLLFLFSGTVFYEAAPGRLQVQQISWNKECEYRMPARVWHALMERHYPNSAWLTLPRDLFDRLNVYKREHGFATWEQALEQMLAQAAREEVLT